MFKFKIKKIFLLTFLSCAVFLCSCNNNKNTNSDDNISNSSGNIDANTNNQSQYINASEYEKNIANQAENMDVDTSNLSYDDSGYMGVGGQYTADKNFLYVDQVKINLSNGRVQSICNIPGCVHDVNYSPGCLERVEMRSPKATNAGIYFCKDNSLYLRSDNEDKIIFTNSFCTEYEETNFPDTKYFLHALIIRKNIIYVLGTTYFFSYNLDTKTASEPVVISKSPIHTGDICGDYLLITNENMELISHNINTGETKKLDDKVTVVKSQSDKIFYVKWENYTESDIGTPILYSANADGENVAKVIENCYVYFTVTENSIYFTKWNHTDRNYYKADIDGKNEQKIVLKTPENATEISPDTWFNIYSRADINSIFLANYLRPSSDMPEEELQQNMLFIIKKDSVECAGLALK
jgi:hypothetical protein